MAIQITSLTRGFVVDYTEKGIGVKVAYAGQDVHFQGIIPIGYDLNRVVVDCLPSIVSLTGISAKEISYAKPKQPTSAKKKNKKQLELL